MIRNIDIKLNAAHPQLPILEATTFVGSPSAVMIHGVPPSVGAWRINAVRVVATYPDNTAHTVAAVLGAAGTWVATIPATETSGRVAQGLQIIADGTDERGESVTGYVLGIAGLAVYTRDMTIESAAGVKYYIHLLDDEPAEPKEGDAYLNGSTLVIYHDGEWTGIGGGSVELDNAVTRTSGNGVKSSGIWSAIWGALTAVPGFSSLYDWCVAQLKKKYEKPQNGIPKTDLSAGVQASLDKADTALQTAPVTSVNGKTGAVTLSASDVGALGNSGNQTLNGTLSLNSNNGSIRTPVIRIAYNTPDSPASNDWIIDRDAAGDLEIRVPTDYGSYTTFWLNGRKGDSAIALLSDLAGLAPLASPAFTGTPTAPTPNEQSADTQIATKKYVDDAVAGGGGGNLDYVMRVDPETGGIYYTTPDTNA